MNIEDIYEFHINKFTPKTIPLGRLGEYMAALAKVLGSEANVHFTEIVGGSVGLLSRVDDVAAGDVWTRVQTAHTNDAPPDLVKAYQAVNDMLYEDGTTADLRRSKISVLRFAGHEMQKAPRMGPISQSIEVDGVLVRVGGKDKTAHVLLEDRERNTWSFELSREQARAIAVHLFGGPIRIIGTIRWVRNEDGLWEAMPHSAKATDFIPLNSGSLSEIVTGMRSAFGSGQKRTLTPYSFLQHLRSEDDELH